MDTLNEVMTDLLIDQHERLDERTFVLMKITA